MRIEQKIFMDLVRKTGLNRAQFARKIGSSRPTIQKYWSGERHMPIHKMKKLAAQFGLKIGLQFQIFRNRWESR